MNRTRPSTGRPKNEQQTRPRSPAIQFEKIHGINAALAVFQIRPADIVRVVHTEALRRIVAPMLRDAAARKIPYNEVPEHEVAKISESVHHEGICIVARARKTLDVNAFCARLLDSPNSAALALDGIGNPHNLGAIVRSAAYFGTDGVLFATEAGQGQLTPAAVRVAEGGAERITMAVVPSLADALMEAKRRRISVVGTDASARVSAWAEPWKRPCIVIMGNERTGLSPAVRAVCDDFVSIPGGGTVDSLNVSVAAGVLLAELARTRPRRG